MPAATTSRSTALRHGTVSAYMTGSDIAAVREVRAVAGRVTVCGRSGLKTLTKLGRDGDLWGVDLDPACYLDRDEEPPALFPFDWVARQVELGLPVVRSSGRYVPRDNDADLREAFAGGLPDGTVRTVSLEASWLKPKGLARVLPVIRGCDDPLALAFAAPFDPLDALGAVDGLRAILDAASPASRRVELLRTDTTGVAFAAEGGSLGAIGLTTTTRHHGLSLGSRAKGSYEQRQSSPLVFTPRLNSWRRGTTLGALTPFGGAGVTGCPCTPCDGRDLLRFDQTWSGKVPAEVSADARAHDLHCWLALSSEVLGAADPQAAWKQVCIDAAMTATGIAETYKVAIGLPGSVTGWT